MAAEDDQDEEENENEDEDDDEEDDDDEDDDDEEDEEDEGEGRARTRARTRTGACPKATAVSKRPDRRLRERLERELGRVREPGLRCLRKKTHGHTALCLGPCCSPADMNGSWRPRGNVNGLRVKLVRASSCV